MGPSPTGCCGITRRGFLLGAGTGLVAGMPLTWLGLRAWQALQKLGNVPTAITGPPPEDDKPPLAMPGRFPGRVVEVRHPGAVKDDHTICHDVVKTMMDRGMRELTGTGHATEAWRSFFSPDDVVGIKVNPVGQGRPNSHRVGAISSPAVLLEVVEGLKSAGLPPRNIIVFERYANEFRDAGYVDVMSARAMDGIRWYASSSGYDNTQLDIEGLDARRGRRDRDPHVVGYDPDVFVHMGFCQPEHHPRDDRRFRSHLSLIVTRMVNKLVTIPVLKDHRSAGVTMALKNLSHGLNNNVARSHISSVYRLGETSSNPNQCNTFIPTAAGQLPIRQKATLHIMDGLIGVYEGGPGIWNPTWATWRRQSLFFATDPVATDMVGWDIINRQRALAGLEPVERMGLLLDSPAVRVSTPLAEMAAGGPYDALALAAARRNFLGNQATEQFDRRQPEHVLLAGTKGLGRFENIYHRRIELRA